MQPLSIKRNTTYKKIIFSFQAWPIFWMIMILRLRTNHQEEYKRLNLLVVADQDFHSFLQNPMLLPLLLSLKRASPMSTMNREDLQLLMSLEPIHHPRKHLCKTSLEKINKTNSIKSSSNSSLNNKPVLRFLVQEIRAHISPPFHPQPRQKIPHQWIPWWRCSIEKVIKICSCIRCSKLTLASRYREPKNKWRKEKVFPPPFWPRVFLHFQHVEQMEQIRS